MLLPESDFAADIAADPAGASVLLIWENIPESTHVYFFPKIEGELLKDLCSVQDMHLGGSDFSPEQEAAMDRVSDYLQSPGGKAAKLKGASTSSEEMPDPLDFEGGKYGEDDCQDDYLDACAEYQQATEDFVIDISNFGTTKLVVIRCGFFM